MFQRLGLIGALALGMFIIGKTANAVIGVGGDAPMAVVSSDDAEMNAAHSKARSTLPAFWSAFENQSASEKNFALKVRFPVPGKADSGEHVWMLDVKRDGDGRYSGRLDNKPRFLPDYEIGQRLAFNEPMISDWMFTRRGKIVGNESMRPLLARMPKEKADQLRGMLESP